MSSDHEEFTELREIESGGRIAPTAVEVTQIASQPGVKNSARLRVRDLNGDTSYLNVWDTHNINIDWEQDNWYVLVESRAKVWNGSGGATRRSLSSTSEMGIEQVGTEPPRDPSAIDIIDTEPNRSKPPNGEGSENGGIFNGIKEEF